jgi:hypothetical protein
MGMSFVCRHNQIILHGPGAAAEEVRKLLPKWITGSSTRKGR